MNDGLKQMHDDLAVEQTKFSAASAVALPCIPTQERATHRQKSVDVVSSPFFSPFACVASPISPKVAASIPAAKSAADSEWAKLVKAGTWELTPVPYAEAIRRAKQRNVEFHHSRIFIITVMKHSEDALLMKYKARAVLNGSFVNDEFNTKIDFENVTSSATSFESARSIMALSAQENWCLTTSDAESAYIQAELDCRSSETYVTLPQQYLCAAGLKMQEEGLRPVFKLRRALYGHPQAGALWEAHRNKLLKTIGWTEVLRGSSVFTHKTIPGALSIYVDDFVLACHASMAGQVWKEIGQVIRLGPVESLTRFLGCEFAFHKGVDHLKVEISMPSFISSCVDEYCKALPAAKLKKVSTPF